jgi:phosphohistidine phosphatase
VTTGVGGSELILMRHAKSDWMAGDSVADFERPLSERGVRASARMGRWLAGCGWHPDRIVSSPAVRARQTVETICREAGFDPSLLVFDEAVYLASVDTLLSVVARHRGGRRRLMMVGHNPGFDDLLEYLCEPVSLPRTGRGKLMTTAALARIEVPESDLAPGRASGRLLELKRPKDLD